jgi:hypothetical protein
MNVLLATTLDLGIQDARQRIEDLGQVTIIGKSLGENTRFLLGSFPIGSKRTSKGSEPL